MSIRTRVLLTIILIATPIIFFSIGTGLVFIQSRLETTLEKDMKVISEIANVLVETKIDLLKSNAETAAEHLLDKSGGDLDDSLKEQVEKYGDFIALTVIDHTGIVTSYGRAPTPNDRADSVYVQAAFNGEKVISTTREDPTGQLVFHVLVPMGDDRVLAATIPGMFFSDLLAEFKIWDETGNLFMVDEEGTIIASIRPEWVLERYNFPKIAATQGEYERFAEVVLNMVKGKSGVGRYKLEKSERLCVYAPVNGSGVSWSLGIIAPIETNVVHSIRGGLFLLGAMCLSLSTLAALLTSRSIERPYKKMSDLTKTLEYQEDILRAINDAAAIFLSADMEDFDEKIQHCMEMIGRRAGVDRMRLWKNHYIDGKLHCTELYEWSGGAELQQGKDIVKDVSYDEKIPGWELALSSGGNVHGITRLMSEEEQRQLAPQGIKSLLVTPVIFKDKFWGFVAFDNCHEELLFSEIDENLLRSSGVLIASAVLRNEMTHDLVRAREAAEASTEAKSDFLANMSHEMRTLLNAIIGFSGLTLDSRDVGENARESLEKVYNSGVSLLSIINDILDISKIEAGKFELIPVEYDVPSLINDTITLNIVRIGGKSISFRLDIDANLPNTLLGDELRTKQIFNNLLSNAFKYTNEGNVDWSVSCEEDGDGVWLVSTVKDSGIGIKPKDMEKLFSEYNQVDTKSNRKIEGTGLGLAISKRVVAMMGGTISVESEYGEGTTFTVRMRQGRVPSAVPIGAEVAENLRNFHYDENKRTRNAKLVRAYIPYAKVLVVDDIPTNLDVARGMMKPYGMQIDTAPSGQAAIELIKSAETEYNAIFMDHMMPEMDGIEATHIIRRIGTDYAKNIPIIALTANALVGNEEMFLKSGFQAFLPKPIDILRLDLVINHWVRDRVLEELIPQAVREAEAESSKIRLFDGKKVHGVKLEQGLRRFGDDDEIYLDVLKSYVRNTPPLIEQIRDFDDIKDIKDYGIIVHGIKSSSRSIGADAAGKDAEALEFAAKAKNISFIRERHLDFIKKLEILLFGLHALLAEFEIQKEKKPEPDKEVLASLLEASKNFDIDLVDKAMEELESYNYEQGGDLVSWLREQINVMGFTAITERLDVGD
ncbi:hypothetical protein AGMMS49975_04870 [Clostridia bacterium]|nr:hypothetical protein AGMMS49975_04870 [Clostridia bacterium]